MQIKIFMILLLTMMMIGRYSCQSPEFARLGIRKNFRKNLSTTSTTLPPLLQNSKTPPPLLLLLYQPIRYQLPENPKISTPKKHPSQPQKNNKKIFPATITKQNINPTTKNLPPSILCRVAEVGRRVFAIFAFLHIIANFQI